VLRGAIAAAVTPLRDGGAALDEDAFAPYVDYLAEGGVVGVLALGTTGEGIALAREERQRAAELFLAARLPVIVHAGAQTTADTVALAAHAAEHGAVGVAVIGPPYFAFDERALLEHFAKAAAACAPAPFYVYEFERASGYAVPLRVIELLRERAPNLAGLKVSDAPFEKVRPYLLEGLDVFIGAEALLGDGLAAGAAGGVSGLAAAFPEVVAEAVRTGDSRRAGELRAELERYPRHAALKLVLQARGVPIHDEVRAPLRRLIKREREELLEWLASS
jgi:dihydrodipicolinate synthase/N-acetylneuraminate lyase